MRSATFIVMLAGLGLTATAQTHPSPPTNDSDGVEQLIREWVLNGASDPVQHQIAERRSAEHRQQEFLNKACRFIDAWNRFANSYSKTHTFNVKLAGEVQKAFRELEKDDGWLKSR